MTALQILAACLAAIAFACFFQSALVLGPDGTGWRDAHIAWRWGLIALALFWLAAAAYALSHPAIVTATTLVLVAVFAKLGLLVLVICLNRRAGAAGDQRGGFR